ncbi:sulfur carrier protein ThiS [Kiloniella laminariae]|uniref:Sulfur carrier protein ThiS n=1 Tax=Kiloniella laminariae TaxID=454162 RepID=A0ABT4LM02_9PROT|nr:sulfur carrier protein ThiS [Kiloniella laminariae]MCZ4282122.1 sulfur carrier protein ThiS [Kiloniella laminariae]
MRISLNGQELETAAENLADLLNEQGYGSARVATALNGELAPASCRKEMLISQGDAIEIVAPMQGG